MYNEPDHIVDSSQVPRTFQTELCIGSLPRHMHINSDKESRTLSNIKEMFRKKDFFHKDFDCFLNSREGKDYYLGIHREKDYGTDPMGFEWQQI